MSFTTPKEQRLRRSDLSRGGYTADHGHLHRLWFELLALSPSYELARRYRANENALPPSDRARLPDDFENVLAVYDDFGDVQTVVYRDWWLSRGYRLLGSRGDRPQTEFFFKTQNAERPGDHAFDRARLYFRTAWIEAHQPEVMVLAVPLNIGRQKALREVKRLIDAHAVPTFEPPPPKYALVDKRMHTQSIIDAVRVLYVRAAKPEYKLWQVGVTAEISKSYSHLFDVNKTRRNATNSEELRNLEMMTSRKLRQARYLAENAARGIFPSMKQPEHMADFDFLELQSLIAEQIRWRKAASKKPAAPKLKG